MRPLTVVAVDEGVEARLLLEDGGGGRFRRFRLEREVHPLVAAVLLGMAGPDAFDPDTEAEPPYRQLAQAVQRLGRGERDAVIGPDGGWQPKPLTARSKPMTAVSVSVEESASQVSRYRLAKSVIVSGSSTGDWRAETRL